ncbi:efflux RND transporter periplasmic adaptor subunit [Isosphaeraceae bacterium EP7]
MSFEVQGETPPTRWQRYRMLMKVVELRLRFIALMAVTGLVFGYWDTIWNHYEKWNRPTMQAAQAGLGLEYYCPMHPNVVRPTPDSCPICGMPLSSRKVGKAEQLPEGVTARLQLAPLRIAQAGVRTVEVGYSSMEQTITTVGSVDFDERRRARIASRLKGMARVESLAVNFNGTRVKAGEPLAELYSTELYQGIQELLLAHRSASKPGARPMLGMGDPGEAARSAGEKLRRWGLSSAQVEAIAASGKAVDRMPILSPIGGVVIRKAVVEGQYVAEGETMFEVADLGHVWVKAQVFEDQFALVRVGQSVRATVEAYPGRVFSGTVAFIDPVLDVATRTVGVRYDLENADEALRPGMFATVTLKVPVAGRPGQRVAKTTPRDATAEQQEICPVTTAKLGSMGKPIPVQLAQGKVWICCEGCSDKLQNAPAKYLARLAPAPVDGVLSVPDSAVIDTGAMQVVYVEAAPGVYEGRKVVLGPRSGDRFPVLEGLHPGDVVVSAGAFLIDAETRLDPTSAGTPAEAPAKTETPHTHAPASTRSASAADAPVRR